MNEGIKYILFFINGKVLTNYTLSFLFEKIDVGDHPRSLIG